MFIFGQRVCRTLRSRALTVVLVPLLPLVLLVAAAPVACAAANPGFQPAVATINPNTGALDVAFTEVGVVRRTNPFITLTTGHNPGFPGEGSMSIERCYAGTTATTNRWYPVGQPSAKIPATRSNRGVVSVHAPISSSFTCPSGQRLFLDSVTYLGVSLTGSAGETLAVVPNYISAALHIPLAPKR